MFVTDGIVTAGVCILTSDAKFMELHTGDERACSACAQLAGGNLLTSRHCDHQTAASQSLSTDCDSQWVSTTRVDGLHASDLHREKHQQLWQWRACTGKQETSDECRR